MILESIQLKLRNTVSGDKDRWLFWHSMQGTPHEKFRTLLDIAMQEHKEDKLDEILRLLKTGRFMPNIPVTLEASEQFDADDFLAAGMIDEEEEQA